MNYQVSATPFARLQVAELTAWWSMNRPSAPGLNQELQRIYGVLSSMPYAGVECGTHDKRKMRRMPLRKTPYFVYYEILESQEKVLIHSVWSTIRKHGPPLRLV